MASKVTVLAQSVAVWSRPILKVVGKYAAAEMTPPKVTDFPAIRDGFSNLIHATKTAKWKNFTVREAGLNTLVAIEIWCWFFVGECIGKLHIVGYKV